MLEDLSITKLKQKSRSKRMTQSFSDASLGLMRNRLISKAECAGCEVVLVDPKGTSQTCSQCGTYVKKGLDVRVHECPVCGYTADRDVNAARNILYRGLAWQAGPGQRTNSPPF
ncbi:MAG: transposase [Candidatus Methanomethylophilaceae archaeon]|nr:transposase [Candidatus Methanomethylophilaceae archaeon]MBQ9689591.1 transposase [Candidatus Methanomethylophilaceae archaeon]